MDKYLALRNIPLRSVSISRHHLKKKEKNKYGRDARKEIEGGTDE